MTRHCDVALGYDWPSAHVSEGGSSALDDPRSSSEPCSWLNVRSR